MRELSEAGGAANTTRPLTRSLDLDKEGLAVKATQCSIDGCTMDTRTPGSKMCDSHYKLKWRYGSPTVRKHVKRGTPFWDRVAVVDDPDSCWEWIAGASTHGRGVFTYEGRQQYAYRVSWQLTYGPIPGGMHVCHRCDNPKCVRPGHLFLGTHADNMHDGVAKGRIKPPANGPRGETHHDATASDELIARVRAEYAKGGISQRALAARYGVAQTTIGQWVRNRTRRVA